MNANEKEVAAQPRGESPNGQSLVPLIEVEEERLARELERAREEAQDIVARAERRAAARLEETRRSLPLVIEAKRQSAREAFEKEADALRSEASDALARLKATVARGREAAISHIVNKVIS